MRHHYSALGYMTPVGFATKWQEENPVLLAQEVDQGMGFGYVVHQRAG
jgi:hypothetical protein